MPSASTAKLEKQASSEALDPIKQGIVFIEHKIRNLSKKKGRLDAYKALQSSGKDLDSDQVTSLLKYDELCQNLIFAQDLSKQLNNISVEWSKGLKKKEKKEAYEREQQEAARVKEILIIQDVLASMGSDTVREDFLAGRNKAVKLTETELQYLDELFGEVSPKREPEENQPPFQEQVQSAAKHLLNLVEGKDKEIVGTKYSELKKLIEKINTCGYFDNASAPETTQQEEPEEAVPEEVQITEPVEPEHEEIEPAQVPHANFQHHPASLEPVVPVAETAGLYISQRPMADVLTNVMGAGPTTFNFIQESELEPEVIPAPTAMAIPTQTFTNASFTPAAPAAAPVYAAPLQTEPVESQQFEPSNSYDTSQGTTGAGDWNEAPEQTNDWPTQVESRWNEPSRETGASDEWTENSNDGFQTAGRGGGRGGRGRGGSDRGRGGGRGRGNYQNGQGGYYNRNNGDRGNNYQNGYQPRGDSYRDNRGEGYRDNRGEGYRDNRDNRGEGYRDNRDGYRGDGGSRRGGPRGGGQDRGGPRSDRGPRGSGRGGNRGSR